MKQKMKINNFITGIKQFKQYPENNICFSIRTHLFQHAEHRFGQSIMAIEISSQDFIKQANFTNLCEQKAIILQLLNPENVNNFSMPKVTLLVEAVPHPTRQKQELQNVSFLSSLPLKTKGSDRYMLAGAPLIDFFKCLEDCCHVTSTTENLSIFVPRSRILL